MGAKKQIRRRLFRGGAYHSAFPNPRRATEKSLLSFLKKHDYDLGKIFHSPPLCQVIYRFFRARMSQKITFKTFLKLGKAIISFPVKDLRTADAVFCFLAVTNCLAHQAPRFQPDLGFKLLRKKNEAILHLASTLPGCFILKKDPLGKKGYRNFIARTNIPDESFHISDELARIISANYLDES